MPKNGYRSENGFDWLGAEAVYVASDYSINQIASMFGIPATTVAKHCKVDEWVAKRSAYRQDMINKALAERKEAGVDRLKKIADCLEKVQEVTLKAVEDPEQFYRYVMQERDETGATTTQEYVLKKMDMGALKAYIKILTDLIAASRDLYDIPTAARREASEIARERLELEKAKAAAMGARAGDDDDSLTGIIEIPAARFEEDEDDG